MYAHALMGKCCVFIAINACAVQSRCNRGETPGFLPARIYCIKVSEAAEHERIVLATIDFFINRTDTA